MTVTRLGTEGADAGLEQPRLSGGLDTEPWTGTGYAPAGVGITTTARDLARYAQALLDGRAPGQRALEPLGVTTEMLPGAPGMRMGLGWLTVDGTSVAWHNGGTGGMRTVLALDLQSHRAAIVLNASSQDVTGLGLLLIGQEGWPASLPDVATLLSGAVALLPILQLLLGALVTRSRLTLLAALALGFAGVVTLAVTAPWSMLPGALLGGGTGLLVAGGIVAGCRWRSLGWLPLGRIGRVLTFIPVLVAAPLAAWMLVVLVLRLG